MMKGRPFPSASKDGELARGGGTYPTTRPPVGGAKLPGGRGYKGLLRAGRSEFLTGGPAGSVRPAWARVRNAHSWAGSTRLPRTHAEAETATLWPPDAKN